MPDNAAPKPVRPVENNDEAPSRVPARTTSKRPFVILGIAIALAGLGILGYSLLTANEEETDDAQVEADVVPIGSRISGQILKVPVEENQVVKKGDLLVVVDDADYAARVAQAQAELVTAQAQSAAADAQEQVVSATAKGGFTSASAAVSGSSMAVNAANAQVAAAKAALDRAKADARKADLDLARNKELRAANAVPQERFDNAQIAYDSAQATLAQAIANLSAAEDGRAGAVSRVAEAKGRLDQSTPIDAQIATAHANAELARARVKSAEAALTLAQNQLSYTKITAPEDGEVSKLSVHPGQLVAAGQPVAELVPIRTYVVANYKETQTGRMRPGQRATITIDSFKGRKLEAVVESLSGGTGARFSMLPPDNATGNFVKVVQRVPVRLKWVNQPPDLALRAGLSADVTVNVNDKP
jgi:membrane fusion protein, multidrug efflux system